MSRDMTPDMQSGVYEEVARLASAGKLKVKVEKTFPLAQAGQAQALSEQGHTEGKIVLIVNEAKANRK
jgi:NADPH:quinone reductase-like Zn-dependent oxidoreductase